MTISIGKIEMGSSTGGVLLTKNGDVSYYYRDKAGRILGFRVLQGILTYVPMEEALKALE